MPPNTLPRTTPSHTPGATLTGGLPGLLTLKLPAGPGKNYRLAQLDDYTSLPRRAFPWQPPLTLTLRARVSAPNLPGTWGFGLWNDPFSLNLGLGGGARRFPALPNAAWYFYASPPNHLSFRNDLPAQGLLAATFRAPPLPAPLLAAGTPGLPLLAWPPTARLLRPLLARVIRQDAALPPIDPTQWHTYTLRWETAHVTFTVDSATVLHTPITPRGPLGFVLWIDNQYAALPPAGGLRFGALPNAVESWLEIQSVEIV